MLGALALAGHGASLTIRGRRIVRQEGRLLDDYALLKYCRN